MKNWIHKAVFYHIYPLGFCGAPRFHEDTITHSIIKIIEWIPHMKQLGINALYLGPVFESHEHGYDTSDYRKLDSRLGNQEDFIKVCDALHTAGIHIVLDGVFNHVGRDFWAFQDVLKHRENSCYTSWFQNLRFDQNNPMNDGLCYDTWQGYHNLIKLNLKNEDVIQYLLESVGMWMDNFHIDGLRLDAADCVDRDFFRRLKTYCKQKSEQFWLMGEIIHGDYTLWANQEMLDSVTNYECYKGLYSSHNDKNYFEIGHSLQRQFGKGGIYEHLHLYNFVDNHDVNRLASTIKDKNDLKNIYTLLYTMPGIPSIYYGSEWAMEGIKHDGSDKDIRPSINLKEMKDTMLCAHLSMLGKFRAQHSLLFDGGYDVDVLTNEQYVFHRFQQDEIIYVALNVSEQAQQVTIKASTPLHDILHDQKYAMVDGNVCISLQPKDACILIALDQEHENFADITSIEEKLHEIKMPTIKKEITYDKNTPTKTSDLHEELQIGRYEHFKGKHYAVLYLASHSETLEPYVVYRQLYGEGSVWIRPLSMFQEVIEHEGKRIPRFRYLGK